ncbi:hypothetical protein QLL95_gp0538 [Cotonvirus japonicus]|uniref:Uncharacterized protein n=1 Tax=Cotonvirus japonicus TaxID=2811091 RepID=A0ABM7NTT6_9VIRU|nr:hypothetical protein QLL95_gp0538 [Cotonvirus japonicus]BCS83585.1 hypothetical protein [Cotonvirus japonicus]
MYSNILVAISNFPVILPIALSWSKRDYWTCGAISFVGIASFVSHLIENHKHGMNGIGFSETTSYIWNRLDVMGCLIVISRIAMVYYNKYGLNIKPIYNNKIYFATSLLPIIFLYISEYDKYNANLKKIYIPTHCLWHTSIFTSMYCFLKYFIYK